MQKKTNGTHSAKQKFQGIGLGNVSFEDEHIFHVSVGLKLACWWLLLTTINCITRAFILLSAK